jgi:hypothetical protein
MDEFIHRHTFVTTIKEHLGRGQLQPAQAICTAHRAALG